VSALDDAFVQAELRRAWQDSEAATHRAHEEGGFILQAKDGTLIVERWPRGIQNEILVPSHPNGKRSELPIVATFHTHPNPGPEFEQEPSLGDIRAVRDDPDLGHAEFEGEYVIASELVYRVSRTGKIEIVGSTNVVLGIA
jgi:hypothetical protein